jgi:uncharacterized protein (TIGR02466 family)
MVRTAGLAGRALTSERNLGLTNWKVCPQIQSPGSMESSPALSQIRISRMFSTPIITHRFENSVSVNQGLKQAILEAERLTPSTGRSNMGGWRSEPKLLDWAEPAVEALSLQIREALRQVVAATAGDQAFEGIVKINAWANLLRRGNYNAVHNHPESCWSGVYYVDAGSRDPKVPLSGVLEFLDPRPFVEMVYTPGAPFGRPVRIEPENGLMVLFPSWLYHQVHPYAGDEARIAIAFNAAMADSRADR